METHQNYLRVYRKRSWLTQSDIAFLMKLPGYTNLSRCEKGQRTPSIEMILIYHILFNTPIEFFFQKQKLFLQEEMLSRIKQLIEDLRPHDKIPKVQRRITFLRSSLTKLSNTNSNEKRP